MSAIDDTIPAEVRLSLYPSMRFLQELQVALQLRESRRPHRVVVHVVGRRADADL